MIIKKLLPAVDFQAICLIQSTSGAGNLIINGNLRNTDNNAVSFIKDGYSNQVAISSTSNLSAATFTISGTFKDQSISVTLAGPNNGTVTTSSIINTFFDVVSSVSVDRAVSNVSVGSGGMSGVAFSLGGKNANVMVNTLLLNNQNTGSNTLTFAFFSSLEENFSLSQIYTVLSSYARPNSSFQNGTYAVTSQASVSYGFYRNNHVNIALVCIRNPPVDYSVTAIIED